MASTDKLMRARTKFKVINSKGSHFKMSMSGTVTGRVYNMPGQFHTYYGHASLSLDLVAYGSWKGELWGAHYSKNEPDVRDNGEYTTYFIIPWRGYDLSRVDPYGLPVQSCKMSYSADFLVDDVQRTANIVDQELVDRVDDLSYIQGMIGSTATPRFYKFMYNSSGGHQGGTRSSLSIYDRYLTFPIELPSHWSSVLPIDMIDGVRSDNWSGGTLTVTSSVNIELVE